MDALQIGADSSVETLDGGGITGEEWVIPDNSAGRGPRFCYLSTDGNISFLLANDVGGTATSPSGKTAATITNLIGCLVRSNQPLVVNTAGFNRIITISFDGTGAENLAITPLEN